MDSNPLYRQRVAATSWHSKGLSWPLWVAMCPNSLRNSPIARTLSGSKQSGLWLQSILSFEVTLHNRREYPPGWHRGAHARFCLWNNRSLCSLSVLQLPPATPGAETTLYPWRYHIWTTVRPGMCVKNSCMYWSYASSSQIHNLNLTHMLF